MIYSFRPQCFENANIFCQNNIVLLWHVKRLCVRAKFYHQVITAVWKAGELQGLQKKVFIEPLVGHLRHPRGLKPCTSPESVVHVGLLVICLQVFAKC